MACIHLSVLPLHYEAKLNKYTKITFLIHTKRIEYPLWRYCCSFWDPAEIMWTK